MKKILIIEDDIVFGRSIGNSLKRPGNGMPPRDGTGPGKEIPGLEEFDLVLADLRLPDGNSTELLRWTHEKCLAVPFLIMTNYGEGGERCGSHATGRRELSLQAHTTGRGRPRMLDISRTTLYEKLRKYGII